MNKEEPTTPPPKPKEEVEVVPKGTKVDLTKDTVVLDDPTEYAMLVRMSRMLEYLVVAQVTENQGLLKMPDIRDILLEIGAKMPEEKKK